LSCGAGHSRLRSTPNSYRFGFLSRPQFAKTCLGEPFKLTPSGCFLSMWISLEIRGESLLLTLNSFELIDPASPFLALVAQVPLALVAQALLPVTPLLVDRRHSCLRTFVPRSCACDPTSLVDRRRPRLRLATALVSPCFCFCFCFFPWFSQIPTTKSVLFTHSQARAFIQLVKELF
jgi:hypothetical protein